MNLHKFLVAVKTCLSQNESIQGRLLLKTFCPKSVVAEFTWTVLEV